MNRRSNRAVLKASLAGYLIALGCGVLALYLSQAYGAGFSGADEPSHFLNGVFVRSYLQAHQFGNPMHYAVDYYLHYPKLSIGHWPPAYYGFLGVVFLVVPGTSENAMLINLFVAALPAIVVAAGLAYLSGVRVALLGALIYGLAPVVFEGFNFFMLDQALAALALAATVAWIAYVERQSWTRAALFALLFVLAVLVKGNGWLLVFVPVYHIILTRSWPVLRRAPLYVMLAAAAAVVLPWYWLTSRIAADGFNYHAGLPYALLALRTNLDSLIANLTPTALLLASACVVLEFRARHAQPLRWRVVSACLSLILATLTLQSLVPVDIVDRYMAPALPALLILALAGAADLWALLRTRQKLAPWAAVALVLLSASMLAPGIGHAWQRTPKVDFRLAAAVPVLGAPGPARIYLIDGPAGAEGAFIAEAAVHDPSLQNYVVRSSKLFAESNFMGSQYRLKFQEPAQLLAAMRDLGIEYVVLIHDQQPVFPHSLQLAQALQLPQSGYRRILLLPHAGRPGTTEVYAASATMVPNIAAARQLGTPPKVDVITKNRN